MPRKRSSLIKSSKDQDNWYPEYFAQTWYKNTFLVQDPNQIARTTGPESEWNNIFDSGCNFVCLAMILGIDPARLASELAKQSYFREDADLPARTLRGKPCDLVWDQNVPNEEVRSIQLTNFWHSGLMRRVSVTISLVEVHTSKSYAEGRRIASKLHRRKRHVVCGPEAHSHLLAGTGPDGYFVWDPDDTQRSVEENLGGQVTLRRLFHENKSEPIEFWEYQADLI